MDIAQAFQRQLDAQVALVTHLRAIDPARETLARCLGDVARERTSTGTLSPTSCDRLQAAAWQLLKSFDAIEQPMRVYDATTADFVLAQRDALEQIGARMDQ